MASIPLRSYNREIEGMIDRGQTDEAIAHCMHILQFVPKHIGTYRLLGKAFLESRRYSEAADIFQRVLSSNPDDFVANIGMSIIREDEKNLDSAIWHMERAFEAQPSNAAIQEELRRLYGRRDGLEPPKVRLTRGALSRMYLKGNLFNQAIGELRAALSEDPHRTDLQVLLAQAYFLNGQHVEAVETCNAILKKLPYCLEANRILAAILPDTNQALNAKEHLQRLISLDPYFASISPKASSSDEVPEKAVVVERLDFKPSAASAAEEQPAWASSLGVTLQPEQENLPDWLSAEATPPPSPSETPQDFTSQELSETPEEQIPDWMKEAGWAPASGPEQPPPSFEAPEEAALPEGEIVPGEVPDWLREIAPSGALEPETTSPEAPGLGEEILPWLEESQPGASDTVISWLGKQKDEVPPPVEPETASVQGEQEEIPAWMSGLNIEAEEPTEAQPTSEAELPDWIKEFQGAEESSGSGVTDWLENLGAETPSIKAEPSALEEPAEWMKPTEEEQPLAEELAGEGLTLEAAQPAEEIPDWLKTLESETIVEPAASTVPPEQAEPEVIPENLDEESSLAWLESLARKQGVPEEQLTTPQEEQPTEVPGWAFEMPSEPQGEVAKEEPSEAEIPEWLTGEAEMETAQPIEETPDWLKELEQVTPVEEVETFAEVSEAQEAVSAEETPDWLKELEQVTPVEEVETPVAEPEAQEVTPAEEIPDWLKSIEGEVPFEEEPTLVAPSQLEETISPEDMDQDTAIAWLESLAAKQAAAEEPVTPQPEQPAEETAPWVLETPSLAEQPVSEPPISEEITEPGKGEVEFPEWLVEATEPEAPLEPAQPEEAIPDWLSSIETEPPLEMEVQEPAQFEAVPPEETVEIPEYESAVQPDLEIVEEEPQDAALAWLESLARKQGVPEEQLVTHPLKPIEEPPAWVQADAEAAQEMEAPIEITEPVSQVEQVELTQPSDETLPSWLVSEITQPTAPVIEEETAPVEVKPVEKLDLNTANLSELEDLPGIGFILAQAILNYREEHGAFASLEELTQVPGIGPERIEDIKDLVAVRPSLEQLRKTREIAVPGDEDKQLLVSGREAVTHEDIPAALESFSSLVHKQIYLPEIIDELIQILQQRPDHLLAWQTLGDAYVRSNQLQEALSAYIKAEELLS